MNASGVDTTGVDPPRVATGTVGAGAGGTSDAVTATPRRRYRRLLVWVAVVLAFGVLSAVLAGLTARSGVPLDPENPDPEGTQALASVLADQGVQVEVVRGTRALAQTDVTGATLLVQGTDLLAEDSGETVGRLAREAAVMVVLEPSDNVGDVLDLPVTVSDVRTGTGIAPECDSPLWRAGDELTGPSTLVEVTDGSPDALICFPPSAGFNLGGAQGGHLVQLPATEERPRTVLLGIGGALTNAAITEDANAAAGLRLLGADDRLVWFVPTVSDLGQGPPQSLTDVLPRAVVPTVAVLGAALVTLALVRGRRLGPLVTEPLPVVIRSAETTQSRARMYHASGDRRRALAILQAAARRRWALRLGLPIATEPAALVQAVAAATGRHTDEVRPLLTDPTAPDDDTLVRTARALRSLDEGNQPR